MNILPNGLATIQPWHITGIKLPALGDFKKLVHSYGVFGSVSASLDSVDGFDVSFDIEEDKDLTISKLCFYLQNRIYNSEDGYFYPTNWGKIPEIIIHIPRDNDITKKDESGWGDRKKCSGDYNT